MLRWLTVGIVLLGSTACGSSGGRARLCAEQDPRPAACDQECDPQDATNTCPAGFFCTSGGTCDSECTANGTECGEGFFCSPDGQCLADGTCVGLECNVVNCAEMGMPSTTISGTVFAPNGTLPLYGISVYVPNSDPGPLTAGAVCERCGQLPGSPIVETLSDEAGQFELSNVPAGTDIPLIIVSGKWRRQITIPNVMPCMSNTLSTVETSLPKNSGEGDIPKIAISTGDADGLECLVRKLGIDDSEISTANQPGQIHLFTNPDSPGQGAQDFESGFSGGSGDFASSTTELWNSVENLRPYDIVILSCEGRQDPSSKPQASLEAMQAYADLGGRVFASHWQNIWIGGNQNDSAQGIPDWQAVADFNFGNNPSPDSLTATIDEVNNPKGDSFATWMLNVAGSTMRGLLPVTQSRSTCDSVDPDKGEQWVSLDPAVPGNGNLSRTTAMNFQFTTPQNVGPDARCGKVVFSDMHVSADSDSEPDTPYPGDCADGELTPQEKALAFMFFDLASCVPAVVQ